MADRPAATGRTATSLALPRYGGASLADLLGSVGSALGAPGFDATLRLPPAGAYVVMLVDGLGALQLRQHAEQAPYLSALAEDAPAVLTCAVPSTTATSLTSLGTGLPPGRHGVVGFTSRIPGENRLLNALQWDPAIDPLAWQPHRTVFDRLGEAGVSAWCVNQRSFAGSGLTVAGQRGARFLGADDEAERLQGVGEALRERPALVYVYDGSLDHVGHREGCGSAAWRDRLAHIDGMVAALGASLPPGVVLAVTGDHGMVDVPAMDRVDVDDEPELMEGVELLGGEARFRHLYCRSGATADVVACWRDRLDGDAVVLTREEAVTDGWFGEVDPPVAPRIGDVVVAATGSVAVVSRERFPLETSLVGLHGSLTEQEMLVPLLVDAGDGAG